MGNALFRTHNTNFHINTSKQHKITNKATTMNYLNIVFSDVFRDTYCIPYTWLWVTFVTIGTPYTNHYCSIKTLTKTQKVVLSPCWASNGGRVFSLSSRQRWTPKTWITLYWLFELLLWMLRYFQVNPRRPLLSWWGRKLFTAVFQGENLILKRQQSHLVLQSFFFSFYLHSNLGVWFCTLRCQKH